MRDLHAFDRWRMRDAHSAAFFAGAAHDEATAGIFQLPNLPAVLRALRGCAADHRAPAKLYLVIATVEGGWDHVSVSRDDRCPSWGEMDAIKRLFFHDHETALQLHVPAAKHINLHPNCLHLWRPQDFMFPLPDPAMVGTPASRNWPRRRAA